LHHAVKNAPEDSKVLLDISEFEYQPLNISTLSHFPDFENSWGLSLSQLREDDAYYFVKFAFTIQDFRIEDEGSIFADFARHIEE